MVRSSCDGRCRCDSCCRCVRSWHVCNRSRSNSNTRYTLLHRHLGHNRALFARHSLAGCRKGQIRLISKRTSRELVPHFSCRTNNFRPGDGSMSIHLLCLLPCLYPTCKSSTELLRKRQEDGFFIYWRINCKAHTRLFHPGNEVLRPLSILSC